MFKKILPIAMLVSLAACASTESYNIQSEMDEIDEKEKSELSF